MNGCVWRSSIGRVGSSSFLSAEPASRKGIYRTGGTKNVGRGARQVWVRSPLPSLSVCLSFGEWSRRAMHWIFCSRRVGATPRVVYVLCESRAGWTTTTTAPGSRCSSRRCHAEEEEGSRGDAGGRDRPKDHGTASAGALTQRCWRAVGGLTGSARHAGVQWSTRNAGRGRKGDVQQITAALGDDVAADARAVSCDTALCDGSQVREVLQLGLYAQYVFKQRSMDVCSSLSMSRDMPFTSHRRQILGWQRDDLRPCRFMCAGASRALAFLP
jgi:hypothetical protein